MLRRRTIPYVKVQWSNHSTREATWELEEEMRTKYSHLFNQRGTLNFEAKTFIRGGECDTQVSCREFCVKKYYFGVKSE